MKPTLALILAALLTSCMTEYTKVTTPDGTVTEVTRKGSDPGAVAVGSAALQTYIAVRMPQVQPTK